MTYGESLAWLYGTQNRGIKLGLDRVRRFFSELEWSGAGTQFLHVAGTNGKGSVCAMLDSVCRAAGMRTGLFTSPHLVTFRERIRMNGEMAAKEEIAAGLTHIRAVCERMESEPTFFEITTGLALMLFQRAGIEVVALETGMGGRLDATNVVQPRAAVITSIGLDHMQYLGATLEEIAWEKAGIIKPGTPVVIGALPPEAVTVIARSRGGARRAFDRNARAVAGLRGRPEGIATADQRGGGIADARRRGDEDRARALGARVALGELAGPVPGYGARVHSGRRA